MLQLILVLLLVILPIGCSRQTDYPPDIIRLRSLLDNNPKDPVAYQDLIRSLYERGYYNDILKYAKMLLEISPGDSYGYLYLGLSTEKLKRWDEAERYYTELRNRYPEKGAGYYYLSMLRYRMGEYKDCIEGFEKVMALGLGTPDPSIYINMTISLAQSYYYIDDIETAYHILDKALELDAVNKDILYNYGIWLLREGRYEESIKFFNRLISQNPQEAAPYINLGKAYYHSHQRNLAEKAFRDAGRFYPGASMFAEVVRLQDMYSSTYKEINTAVVVCSEQYDYRYGDKYYIRGIIENIGLEMAQWVSVIIRIYDTEDNIIAQKVFEASPRNVRPEQYAFFSIDIPYNEQISYVKIEPNWHRREAPVLFQSEGEAAGRILLW